MPITFIEEVELVYLKKKSRVD